MIAMNLYFPYVACMSNNELLASHTIRISKISLRSKISCVHFGDLVCWVLWVKFDPHSLQGVYVEYLDLFGYAL